MTQKKAIWWAKVNVKEPMTRDDFIKLQNITYLNQKPRKGSWHLHRNPLISIQSWVCTHPDDVFYFQNANENEWDLNPLHHWNPNTT
jgi:hypothetical protein